jgi:hypothetical protein
MQCFDDNHHMPRGPTGEKRPADAAGTDRGMKAILVAVFIGFAPAVAHSQMPPPVSCEGWLEIHDQNGKLATDIRAWIIHQARNQAHDLAQRSYPQALCADLDCIPDAKILAEVNDWCSKWPAHSVNDAVFSTSLILTHLKVREDMDREDKENSN